MLAQLKKSVCIEAGIELFYDHGYEQDQVPGWFLKPGDPKEGSSAPQAPAKKPPLPQSPVRIGHDCLGYHYISHYWLAHNIIRYVIVTFFGCRNTCFEQ